MFPISLLNKWHVVHNYLGYLLHAGAPCTPYSKMGNQQREDDPVYQTHKKFYDLSANDGTQVLLLENVPEYNMKEQIQSQMGPTWAYAMAKVDPRNFGLGCARPRCYALAWNTEKVQWTLNVSLETLLTALFARPVMDALSYFTLKLQPTPISKSEDTHVYVLVNLWLSFGFSVSNDSHCKLFSISTTISTPHPVRSWPWGTITTRTWCQGSGRSPTSPSCRETDGAGWKLWMAICQPLPQILEGFGVRLELKKCLGTTFGVEERA